MSEQRVNIQYSIDLKELPSEVERLVEKFGEEIEETSEIFSEMSPEVISIAGLQSINELRLSLARADHILDDVSKIVTGYIRMNMEAPSENEASPEQASPANPFVPNPETLSSLEDKLREFTENTQNEKPFEISDNQ